MTANWKPAPCGGEFRYPEKDGAMQTFETGATRSASDEKLDPEGFLSPFAVERFSTYMHLNRLQADGQLRASDNWQKGIPTTSYMKSMWRHFLAVWKTHRRLLRLRESEKADAAEMDFLYEQLEADLCGLWFNVQGYLHELVKNRS